MKSVLDNGVPYVTFSTTIGPSWDGTLAKITVPLLLKTQKEIHLPKVTDGDLMTADGTSAKWKHYFAILAKSKFEEGHESWSLSWFNTVEKWSEASVSWFGVWKLSYVSSPTLEISLVLLPGADDRTTIGERVLIHALVEKGTSIISEYYQGYHIEILDHCNYVSTLPFKLQSIEDIR